MSDLPYRPCVVGVFIDSEGRLLVGERSDYSGYFQFPQGGIDKDETPEQAMRREMCEEIGVTKFSVIKAPQDWLTYEFPPGATMSVAQHFRGQIQRWYLLRLEAGHHPNLALASDKEFSSVAWRTREEVEASVIYWKKSVYRLGLQLLLDSL